MDLDLGVYHCQREEAVLTPVQEGKTVKNSMFIPAMLRKTGVEPLSGRSLRTRMRRPGDRVKPNLTLHLRASLARPPTWA